MTNFNKYEKICKGLFKLLNDSRLTGTEKAYISAALEIVEDKKRAQDVNFTGF